MHSQSPNAINISVLFLNLLAYYCQNVSDFIILTLPSFIPPQLTNLIGTFYFLKAFLPLTPQAH